LDDALSQPRDQKGPKADDQNEKPSVDDYHDSKQFAHSQATKSESNQRDDIVAEMPERMHTQDETGSDTEDEGSTPEKALKLHVATKENASTGERPKAEDAPRPKIKSKIGGKRSATPETLPRNTIRSKIGGKRTADEGNNLEPIKFEIREPRASHDNSPTSSTTGETGDEEHENAAEKDPQPAMKELTPEEKALENRMKLKRELEEKRRKTVKKLRKF
jgi:hypothetical protein